MVLNSVLEGYAVELGVELEADQEPQSKRERSLESAESLDYELENDIGGFTDSDLQIDRATNPFKIQNANY